MSRIESVFQVIRKRGKLTQWGDSLLRDEIRKYLCRPYLLGMPAKVVAESVIVGLSPH